MARLHYETYAQQHYLLENKDKFDSTFPTHFVSEDWSD
jgi:hypothetical protein